METNPKKTSEMLVARLEYTKNILERYAPNVTKGSGVNYNYNPEFNAQIHVLTAVNQLLIMQALVELITKENKG